MKFLRHSFSSLVLNDGVSFPSDADDTPDDADAPHQIELVEPGFAISRIGTIGRDGDPFTRPDISDSRRSRRDLSVQSHVVHNASLRTRPEGQVHAVVPMIHAGDVFSEEWAVFYPGRRPIAYMLRRDQALPWVRFHSLPKSKRYPKTAAEKAIILGRAYTIADEILGETGSLWRVECSSSYYRPSWTKPVSGVFAFSFSDEADESDKDEEDQEVWSVHVSPGLLPLARIDSKLLTIARDAIGPTLWMNRDTGSIFAPYDGGFDLFPNSLTDVERLKARHRDWLSDEPSGL